MVDNIDFNMLATQFIFGSMKTHRYICDTELFHKLVNVWSWNMWLLTFLKNWITAIVGVKIQENLIVRCSHHKIRSLMTFLGLIKEH